MNLIELFSGSGSVGKVARDLGFNVISLDLKMLISTTVSPCNPLSHGI